MVSRVREVDHVRKARLESTRISFTNHGDGEVSVK